MRIVIFFHLVKYCFTYSTGFSFPKTNAHPKLEEEFSPFQLKEKGEVSGENKSETPQEFLFYGSSQLCIVKLQIRLESYDLCFVKMQVVDF